MIYAGRTTCASTVHCDMHVMQSTCVCGSSVAVYIDVSGSYQPVLSTPS